MFEVCKSQSHILEKFTKTTEILYNASVKKVSLVYAFYKVLFYYINTTSHRFWLNIHDIKLLESQIIMFFFYSFMIYKKSDLKGRQKRRKDNNISIQKSLFF